MVFVWDSYRVSKGCLWSMGFSLDFYGISMICPLDFFWISMIFFVDFYDISMGLLRDFYWIPMGVLWDFNGGSFEFLWDYKRMSMVFLPVSNAQGGGGSFKNRLPIGELGCCETRMAERIH